MEKIYARSYKDKKNGVVKFKPFFQKNEKKNISNFLISKRRVIDWNYKGREKSIVIRLKDHYIVLPKIFVFESVTHPNYIIVGVTPGLCHTVREKSSSLSFNQQAVAFVDEFHALAMSARIDITLADSLSEQIKKIDHVSWEKMNVLKKDMEDYLNGISQFTSYKQFILPRKNHTGKVLELKEDEIEAPPPEIDWEAGIDPQRYQAVKDWED